MAKKTLGRSPIRGGMSALLERGIAPEKGDVGQVVYLPVGSVEPNPDQPRQNVGKGELKALAASIKEKGIKQPIGIRLEGDRYVIIWGERRWRAAKMAGLTRVPALIEDVEPDEAFEIALIENMQREDLTPLEEANGIQELIQRRGYTHTQASKMLGRSRSQVTQLLSLPKLPQRVREECSTSNIPRTQWFQVASQKTEKAQMKLVNRIISEDLTVRETREITSGKKGRQTKKASPIDELASQLEKVIDRHLVNMPVKEKEKLRDRLLAMAKRIGET